VATEHLGRRAGVWRARATLDALYRKDGAETGDLADLLTAIGSGSDFGILSTLRVAAERLRDDLKAASRASEGFFGALSLRYGELGGVGAGGFGKLRYRDDASVASLLAGELNQALRALRTVADGAETLSGLVVDSDLSDAEALSQAMSFHAERTRSLADDLLYVASAADADAVFWIEIRGESAEPDCELRSAPVSVAEHMESFLFERVESLVLTSATLTVDGSFDFFMERVGLSLLPDWRVLTLDVGSPYDYEKQSIAVVAGYLPPPSSPGFNGLVADLVVKLAAPAVGGTLVLFTSRSALDSVFNAVRDPLTARGKLVLAQGHGGGASALLEQFTRREGSVLLATASFWEGIDVPGRSLEQLVIAKLPFPVPSDPVIEAHCERYEADGENAFERYMVPKTAVKLRQGFGRLIRSTTDTGVVVFLDSRLRTKSYGERLLAELPTRALIARSEAELLAVLSLPAAERAAR
jgi:Rad3-related DNA helicase